MKKGRALSEEDVGKASGGQIGATIHTTVNGDGKKVTSEQQYDIIEDKTGKVLGSTTNYETATKLANVLGQSSKITAVNSYWRKV